MIRLLPPARPRWLNRLYARARGYFWLRCPQCGAWFGGHEIGKAVVHDSPNTGRIACRRHGVDRL